MKIWGPSLGLFGEYSRKKHTMIIELTGHDFGISVAGIGLIITMIIKFITSPVIIPRMPENYTRSSRRIG